MTVWKFIGHLILTTVAVIVTDCALSFALAAMYPAHLMPATIWAGCIIGLVPVSVVVALVWTYLTRSAGDLVRRCLLMATSVVLLCMVVAIVVPGIVHWARGL
jgi:hypothetical protein